MTSSASDPADAIATALARLRGRRMPRPPWRGEAGAPGHGPGGDAAGGGVGDSGRDGHEHDGADDHADGGRRGWMHGGPHGGPHGGRGGWHGAPGGPPWAGGPRIAGPARLRLLDALAAASAPLSVSELAEAVGVDQPRASRLVQQVAHLGLVRREADPDDARRTRVALTDEGRAMVSGFRGERRSAVDAALSSFSEEERAELARLLTKLADSWPR